MTATSIQLSPDVQAQVNSFASQYSVDALVASAVAQVSSGGQQSFSDGGLVVTPFGVGVMGIPKNVANALGFDATTQVGNIQAGVAALAALLGTFVGNYPLALAAYATSVATVQRFNGIPPLAPVQNFVYNVSKIAANAGSSSVSSGIALRNSATLDPTSAATTTSQLSTPGVDGQLYDQQAQGLSNIISQDSIEPILQVPDLTLTNTAWYADTGLVTGNPHIRASVQPVSFIVYLDRNDPTNFLHNPATNKPIEIQLNTSMATFEVASKHVINRTPSRTGMHITLWGMEPDLISGTGTTGVFMNKFGITDFMSTVGINDGIVKLLTSGLTSPQSGVVKKPPRLTADQIIANMNLGSPNEAFRVAAQDAFIEFLKLFQMNGNVWFYSQQYATNNGNNATNLGTIGQTQQESPSAWSKQTGTTSFQQHARNNDVMTRGYVAMKYRNNVYLGYFKSLSWTQDAESPFQWKFNFTFQVEKTYTSLYYHNVQAQIPQGLSQLGQPAQPQTSVVSTSIGGVPIGSTVTQLPLE